MREEFEPAIFKVNPEYKHWKVEQSGAIFPFSIPAQELPISPLHERRLRNYENQAIPLWEKAVNRWITEKARVVEVLDFFPQNKVIPQIVVNAYDRKALKEAMFTLFKPEERWLGVRTCYYPDRLRTAPSKMGLRTEKEIKEFLDKVYPTWLKSEEWGEKNQHLEETIVLGNPPFLGPPEFDSRHFVFMTSVLPHQILTEVRLNTAQLRGLEQGEINRFIHLTMPLLTKTPITSETLRVIVGEAYWNQQTLEETAERVNALVDRVVERVRKTFNILGELKGLSGRKLTLSNFEELSKREPPVWNWPEEEESKTEIEALKERYIAAITEEKADGVIKTGAISIFSPGYFLTPSKILSPSTKAKIREEVRKEIHKTMLSGKLPQEMYQELIDPRAWAAIKDLRELIFNQWLTPPMDLYYRLVTLNRVCVSLGQAQDRGYDTIEVQGAYNHEGKIEYALIYALRGREEKEFGERAKTQVG